MVARAVLKGDQLVWEDDEATAAPPPTTRQAKVAAGQSRKAPAEPEEPGFLQSALDTVKSGIRTAADKSSAIIEGGTQGYTWGVRPRLEGAVAAMGALNPANAFETGASGKSTLDAAKDAYSKQKAFSEQQNVAAQQRAPLTYGGAEIAGAIATPLKKIAAPIAAGVKVIPGGARVLKALKVADEATTVSKTVRPISSAIVSGAKAGTAGGAVTGAIGARDWTDWRDTLNKAKSGALFGLGGGAAIGGLAVPLGNIASSVGHNIGNRLATVAGVVKDKTGKFIRDIAPRVDPTTGAITYGRPLGERAADAFKGTSAAFAARRANASRIKEEAQQQMFDALKIGGVTPKMADTSAQELAAQGGAPITADVTGASQGLLKGLFDKGVKGAKQLSDELQTRATTRGGRVRQYMANLAGLNPATTVGAATRASKARAKAMATQDYDPKTWGQAITHSPEIDKFFTQNRGLLQPLFNEASAALRAAEKPLPTHKLVNGVKVPTIATMDAVVKRLKERVSTLMRGDAPDKIMANSLKSKADALDNILKAQNPTYSKALARQATEFATQDALKLGQQLSGKLFSNPRETHDLMVAYNLKYPNNPKELREAMLSALFDKSISMRALPGKIHQHLDEKSEPEVKAIWNFMMRGQDNVSKLRQWAKKEQPLAETENLLRPGAGSVTNLAQTGRDLAERGEASANASAGRAGIGGFMGNWAMFTSNAANVAQRAMQGHNAAYKRALQARLVKELGAKTKPGELVNKADVLKAARLTRQAKRSKGIRRIARVAGHETAGVTDPGAEY